MNRDSGNKTGDCEAYAEIGKPLNYTRRSKHADTGALELTRETLPAGTPVRIVLANAFGFVVSTDLENGGGQQITASVDDDLLVNCREKEAGA